VATEGIGGVGTKARLLQIGEAAERAGLSLRTVRYWEEVGLVQPSMRSPGGFRLYSEADVDRLTVLKGMKPLGLSLEEIRELMALLDGVAATAPPSPEEATALAAGLGRYAALSEERVDRLERHLEAGRELAHRIHAAVERLPARPADPSAG